MLYHHHNVAAPIPLLDPSGQEIPEFSERELTKRELDVLFLAACDPSNAEIGRELSISPATVKNYITSINVTLGTRSRMGAVIVACQREILSLTTIEVSRKCQNRIAHSSCFTC